MSQLAQVVTTEEFAARLGYNREYVRQMIRDGKVCANRIGRGKYLIPVAELQKLTDAGSVLLTPPEDASEM